MADLGHWEDLQNNAEKEGTCIIIHFIMSMTIYILNEARKNIFVMQTKCFIKFVFYHRFSCTCHHNSHNILAC